MTQTFNVTGMTCEACEYKIKHVLGQIEGVKNVETDLKSGNTTIESSVHLSLNQLQNVLKPHSKYSINEIVKTKVETIEQPKTWFETYKPILLIFSYITLVTLLIQAHNGKFVLSDWMRHFMAGFFLVFSFFKFLNLKGFADSYAMYDVIAKRVPIWGYVYAFTELGLGLAFLVNFSPIATNGLTFAVMSISIVGVLQSVLNKQKIQCACLGAIFDLPMSTVTIIEDALMIVMSGAMLLM